MGVTGSCGFQPHLGKVYISVCSPAGDPEAVSGHGASSPQFLAD